MKLVIVKLKHLMQFYKIVCLNSIIHIIRYIKYFYNYTIEWQHIRVKLTKNNNKSLFYINFYFIRNFTY